MSSKCLLIIPPNITFDAFVNPSANSKYWTHRNGRKYGVLITDVPLGVLTISAWLKSKCDADVRVIDFNTEIHKTWDDPDAPSFHDWFDRVLASVKESGFDPDVIGFSSLFITGYENLLALAETSKRIFPKAFRICGGNLPTTMYREVFSDAADAFDALCFGEGELPISELMAAKDKKAYCDSSMQWVTKKNLVLGGVYQHNFISNLDEIPDLDYDCIDLKDYHLNPTIKAYTSIGDRTNYITYMGSRGCPFHCTFCAAHTVHGRKMRSFTIERIERELTDLCDKYLPNTLVIEDDMFLWDKEWAASVLKIAQKLNLVCFFPNALALYALDRPMLEELYRTGVRQLTLAVESGSARVLKEVMKKPLKLSITNRVVEDCRDLGIYTDCNIIIGMPGETLNDIDDTREYLRTLDANWYRINVATPLAGSEMYIKAVKNGEIKGDIRMAGYKKCVVETKDFTPAQIESVAYDINLEMNFLRNSDIKYGRYERALETFSNVLLLRNDHALAMYKVIECRSYLGMDEDKELLSKKLDEMLEGSPFWKKYFIEHDLRAPAY
ncbi:B12-binding domain-containing radical SAM protein [Chromobacterium sp. IIBBL 290-4]|uniref:B12-binding domain-containing radical SAM protein n=1 Tax=Chromobacterium sp. IIBBL 290-4 TaxID=2953890 RepID=UPI0020B70309|nr:radical SAM protein [Chromobacterium sp. IIBBL 290-4]UTH72228.1 B12-binding domain-containing radical SAM protein [Chromobacterium sp. IIBBL 290-4]